MKKQTYIQFEKTLIKKYGLEKVQGWLEELEENYGLNGLDAYRGGDFELLTNLIDE